MKLANSCVDRLIVTSPGKTPSPIAGHSHFSEPIEDKDYSGNSRKWGDASKEVQHEVISRLISSAKDAKLTCKETALLLAIARVESGFNPDAAAGSSSATSIGQFIDKTGLAYGIRNNNRFSLTDNANALVEHLKDNLSYLRRRWPGINSEQENELAYALHHDGPSLSFGGRGIAREKVLPWAKRILSLLQGGHCSVQAN